MKVLTFSRYFPATHTKKGGPTKFVEKILLSLIDNGQISISKACEIGRSIGLEGFTYIDELRKLDLHPKHHTIRGGKRWRKGDVFSARFWSSKPYASKQISFAPQIEIMKTWTYEVDENGVASIDGAYTTDLQDRMIAKNDGLALSDFNDWLIVPCFKKAKPFRGQIICWNENLNY